MGRNSGIIRNCNVNAEVTAGSVAGVFAGELENGSIIKNCNVYGQIHGVRKYNINNPEIIGGFSGYLLNSQVDNCSIDVIIDIEDGGYGNYGIVSGVALNSTITNFEYNKNVTLNYNFSGDSNNSTLFDVKEH